MDGLLVFISILLAWQLLENIEMSEKLDDVKNDLKKIERKIK
ncbi:hypothetical protein IMAU80009_02972 [Lactiplantibacillus plantarum]|nr:hypothetical protein [Lactiplantibacillus plantarum]